MQIQVYERHGDTRLVYKNGKLEEAPVYHTQIVGTKLWGTGISPQAAVGDLIMAHPEQFGINAIEYIDKKLGELA